jgi:hypothetical protein
MKEIENRKKKRETKIEKGPRGNHSAWSQKRPMAQLDKSRTGTYHSLPLTDAWTPPVRPADTSQTYL